MDPSIKLIIFDLDGVLVDSRDLHYDALNMALAEIDTKYVIQRDEHLAIYDGNSTGNKLKMLTKYKGLPSDLYDKIWNLKQEKTMVLINEMQYDERLRGILSKLKQLGYKLFCASNSIWNTLKLMLTRKGFIEYLDFFISNEDVKNHKPSSEMYLQCLIKANISPKNTLILEDSPIGRQAAIGSGCHLCPIIDSRDVTIEKINKYITLAEQNNKNNMNTIEWLGNINIVIPMAGLGSRFKNVGYKNPKPLIDLMGKPLIQHVVENINIKGNYIYIVQKSHLENYCLEYLLKALTPNCVIIPVDKLTEGAACSVMLAEKYIDNDLPLLIANSDQVLEWDSNAFLYCMTSDKVDGGISTFKNNETKWSYVKLDNNGFVTEAREKEVISDHASTGIYYWRNGSDFVKYTKQMISKNIRVNNEFYVCPVYNEAINDGKKIKIKDCDKMWGLGVPCDLEEYLKSHVKTDDEYNMWINKSING